MQQDIAPTDNGADSLVKIEANFTELYGKTDKITNASASAPASLDLAENTDNGTNKITITAPSAIASDKVITLPDATDTLVGKATTDTLTNKTLTSPVLSDTTPTADGAIGFDRTNEDLVVGDGSASQLVHMGAWKSWTPTWTNLTVGNGTVAAKYTKIGKTVIANMQITLGSTSSVSGLITFTLPLTAVSMLGNTSLGNIYMLVAGTPFNGFLGFKSTTQAYVFALFANTTYSQGTSTSGTIPATWASGDTINGLFMYEAA